MATKDRKSTNHRSQISANFLAFFVGSIIAYALFELSVYLALVFGFPLSVHPFYNLAAWSTSFAQYDSDIGYRLNPRVANSGIRVINGNVQFYYTDIQANASGFRSNFEYTPTKGSKHRIVVYGDSFTAGLYQRRSWTETLQSNLRDLGRDVEVYNFSFDGGGVYNWSRHYFRELKGHYDYDTVIFAVCCDDLDRGLAVYHADPASHAIKYAKFNGTANSVEEFERDFLPRMYPVLKIIPASELADIARYLSQSHRSLLETIKVLPFDVYGAMAVMDLIDQAKPALMSMLYTVAKPVKDKIYDILGLSNRPKVMPGQPADNPGGSESPFVLQKTYDALLIDMIRDLKNDGKQVILLTVPADRPQLFGLPRPANPRTANYPNDVDRISAIAKDNCLPYVSGYDYFANVPRDLLDTYWPSYDGHWLDAGSDHFAAALTPQVAEWIDRRDARGCN